MGLQFAQSARRHRIGRARVRQVLAEPVLVVEPPPDAANRDRPCLFLGDDDTGRALEVIGVFLADGDLLVIHAMDLRAKYRPEKRRRSVVAQWVSESGQLDEVGAAQLADEAERGYEVPGRGRPSLTGDAAVSPQVSFRLSPELRERAAQRAAAEGKTVSQLAREALERVLAG